ncbi:MAG TPA: serine protease, partial [Verrucomicrobia bacterium]|nr:serine protease [Verrucomicrobiota bacterium]
MFFNTIKNPRLLSAAFALGLGASALGQSVILPAPRLLTTLPMGGKVGTTFEITISGDDLDGITGLYFSHPGITAKAAAGKNKFAVTIAANVPTGIHEARVMARLGISTCRAFTVGTRSEVTQKKPNQTLAQAMELKLGTVCNSVMSTKAVDYYSFSARKGQRVVVECASRGIDSRMNAVLIIADAEGRDLKVDRLGGVLDFTAPVEGKFILKVHELTYKGGAHYFYRLVLSGVAAGAPVPRHPTARTVGSFSWRPVFEQDVSVSEEVEPNNQFSDAQQISLPCQIDGRFFPAADVDTFEFTAKQGEEWWVEVVSERLGFPTDPFVLVQHVDAKGKATDVAELNDIAPPIKPSGGG